MNSNFDTLWAALKEQVIEARTATKTKTHRHADPDSWGHFIAIGNEPNPNKTTSVALSTPHSSAYIRLNAASCRELAVELIARADALEAIDTAHAHPITQPK